MPTTIQLTKVRVKIEGLPPGLLFQSKGLMTAEAGKTSKTKKYKPPEEEAVQRAHWLGNGKSRQLCIPATMLYRCFCQAAMDFKQPDNRKKSMGMLVGSTIDFERDKIPFSPSIKKFETYEDYVRIPPRTGAMVLIGRPLIRVWSADFTVLIDDEMWAASMLEQIIQHAGKAVGIGAWRPGLKGRYGRFVVASFKIEG